MIAHDLSENLVHLTRGDSYQEASGILEKILGERRLLGGTGFIKGEYRCVCFTEAPIARLGMILAQPTAHQNRYMPYGIMVKKQWLFRKGGRPVIYQPDGDFAVLPEELRYRHVRYEPPKIDHSWEREWRIQTEALQLEPEEVTIVVPNRAWADRVRDRHASEASMIAMVAPVMAGSAARVPWHFLSLEDLGVPIPV